jgi:D-glycero-D-manno-heptose 1,7-bisphosphate phosphatase
VTADRHVAFLDRDGTLVESDVSDGVPIPNHGTVDFVDGASQACAELRRLGYALVMVTNQPDVARGRVDRQTVEDANQRIAAELGLDMALTCMHDDLDRCTCRKPRPGMLLQAASTLDIQLDRLSVMIGDRWRDVDAGAAAGVSTVLVDRGYGELLNTTPDHIAMNLPGAVDWIGAHLRKGPT